MEFKQMVESIVYELVKAMQAEAIKPPKVLYIFCDSTAHEAFMDDFILLQKNGIEHDILFLDGETSAWLGMHRIESGGPGKIITADEYAPAPMEVPLAYDGIVIPEIDLDNAGRAALGMKGTVKSDIIFASLVLNKFVLVGDEAQGLKRADRRTLKVLELPNPYKKLLDYYKKEMQMYGVEFVPLKQLAEQVVRKCADMEAEKAEAASNAPISSNAPNTLNARAESQENRTDLDGTVAFEGKLLSAEWVKDQSFNHLFTRLLLAKGTILSPLAMDLLKEKGIVVHYAEER